MWSATRLIGALRCYKRSKSGSSYLLATSYPGDPRRRPWDAERQNYNIPFGGYYAVDLMAPPFSLPEPLEMLEEGLQGKWLYLYHLPKLCSESEGDTFISNLKSRVSQALAEQEAHDAEFAPK